MQYEEFRREYTAGGLSRERLEDCPLRQFERWLEQAVQSALHDPTAMVLATVDAAGRPWQRIVLLKGLADDAFVFYTNYDSDKARAMAHSPRVSLLFPWNELDRQVIVSGSVEQMGSAASAAYFSTRPRESQIAAWASRQSRAIATRAELEQQALAVREQFGDDEIPVPPFWGGYRVLPERLEFWQGGAHRLHDRFVYSRNARGDWEIEQLQP